MTEKQKTVLSEIVNYQLYILDKIIKIDYKNEWTQELDELIRESIDILTWNVENSLLNPIETLVPLTRKFKKEDESVRKEIGETIEPV